jgi:peptide/nickel transport system ATP-binding protein
MNANPAPADASEPLLRVRDLRVSFRAKARGRRVMAVNGVSFDVGRGETVGLVGESGSGKSTIARAIMRLIPADGGTVQLDGTDLLSLDNRQLRSARQHVQMVFQDPYSSMNPSMVVSEIIGEPLAVQAGMPRAQREARVAELLEAVGLSRRHRERYPYEFSGGQRQRIAIARALANNPKLVILDEAVSALDVSTQNQIINLLEDLQEQMGVSFLFIAHDLAVVRHIARRTVVLYLGRVMEDGPSERIFESPAHPYADALLSAVPVPNPVIEKQRSRIVLLGEPPDPTALKPGCPFVGRCRYAMDICSSTMPEPTPVDGGGVVACHLQTSGPTLGGRSVVDLRVARG